METSREFSEVRDWERFQRHFPVGADLTLQILKGHLLVEELLREILEIHFVQPDAMRGKGGTSLECHDVICLVEALSPLSQQEPWLWSAARRLNKLRNQLAHSLESKGIEDRVSSLIEYVTSDNPAVKEILGRLGIPDGREFEAVILAMCGALSALKERSTAGLLRSAT